MSVFFWQNILSPHQSAAIRALAGIESEVVVVATSDLTPDRKRMGWGVPDFGPARLVVSPDVEQVDALIRQAPPESVHIVAGARWTPLGNRATDQCIRLKRHLGIMSESADDRGLRGCARWLKYTVERVNTGRHFDFVLAIGQTGTHWFRRCGYPARRLFPYAYFTESPQSDEHWNEQAGGRRDTNIIYLGRCIPGKGLEVLIESLGRCRDQRWTLDIIGDGPLRRTLEAQASSRSLADRVRFLSFMEHTLAMEQLSAADLLILPSDGKEGWGAVVNEALMLGIPVICSDRCGAADLLEESWRGEVFVAGSVPALTEVLRRWIARGKKTPEAAARIKHWSRCIRGESAATYLLAIMKHVYQAGNRPTAPWLL
jgi:glycosyltransferase involved in cell wall biosynthesis